MFSFLFLELIIKYKFTIKIMNVFYNNKKNKYICINYRIETKQIKLINKTKNNK